jgi:hypothetical protein
MKQKEENTQNLFGNLRNDQPFRVPDGYFETFADRLKVRIEEEEQPNKKRSLLFYLKPALMMAASFAFVMLLVYVPLKKYFPSNQGYVSLQQSNKDSINNGSATPVPIDLISYFSEGQFLSAVSDMKAIEAETLSNDSLGDFIAANYSDFEVIANN